MPECAATMVKSSTTSSPRKRLLILSRRGPGDHVHQSVTEPFVFCAPIDIPPTRSAETQIGQGPWVLFLFHSGCGHWPPLSRRHALRQLLPKERLHLPELRCSPRQQLLHGDEPDVKHVFERWGLSPSVTLALGLCDFRRKGTVHSVLVPIRNMFVPPQHPCRNLRIRG